MVLQPVGAIHELPLPTEYQRDLVGNITRIVNPNQTETTVAYDKVYRTLTRINRQTTNGGKINSAYWHSYNDLGHITKTVNQYGWRKPSVVEESYSYDGLRRLSGFNLYPLQNSGGTVTETWSYDPAGNRLSWTSNDDLQTSTPFDGFSRKYEYNEANQMLAMAHDAGKKSKNFLYGYSYDENGNRVNRQLADANGPQHGVDYSYDPENRLIEALDYQLTGKGGKNRIDRAVTSLEYDGGGRRLVQHYDPKNGGGGVDKRDEYVFDGLDPVAEYDKLNGQRTDYYRGEGGNIALMHQYKGGTQGQMYWYHYNNKKDVAGLTKQNGNSHHNYRYEPYGAVLPENGNFTDPHNHYTLTGKEFDENTGLVWFGARHYEPETGVWMGQDLYRGRLSEPMSLHRFGYVGNNPVNGWDWYGYLSYLVSRPLASGIFGLKAGWIATHNFIVTDAKYVGDQQATVYSFGENNIGNVGAVNSSTQGISASTHQTDIDFWNSLINDSDRCSHVSIIKAPDKLVAEYAESMIEDQEYSMVSGPFGANSNSAAQAIANNASRNDVDIPNGWKISPGAGSFDEIKFKQPILGIYDSKYDSLWLHVDTARIEDMVIHGEVKEGVYIENNIQYDIEIDSNGGYIVTATPTL